MQIRTCSEPVLELNFPFLFKGRLPTSFVPGMLFAEEVCLFNICPPPPPKKEEEKETTIRISFQLLPKDNNSGVPRRKQQHAPFANLVNPPNLISVVLVMSFSGDPQHWFRLSPKT